MTSLRARAEEREDLGAVGGALDLSARVLLDHPGQLAAQLIGRLAGVGRPGLDPLLRQARDWSGAPWIRPLTPCLTPPGGTLRHLLTGHLAPVNAVAVAPRSGIAVSASSDGSLRVWDLLSGGMRHRLTLHDDYDRRLQFALKEGRWTVDSHLAVAVTPDGGTAVAGSWEGDLVVWDLEGGSLVRRTRGPDSIFALSITPDGRRVLAGGGLNQGWLGVREIESGAEVLDLAGHTAGVRAVAVAPDGRLGLSASLDGTARVWDLSDGREIRSLPHPDPVLSACFSADSRLAITGSQDHVVRVWEIAEGREAGRSLTLEGPVNALGLGSDGQSLAAGSGDGAITVWDLGRREVKRVLTGHGDEVHAVAFAAADRVVSGSQDATLRLWDLTRADGRAPEPGHAGAVLAVAVVTGGRHAVSAGADSTLRVWDTADRRELRVVRDLDAPVTAIAAIGTEPLALTGSRDGSLRLWNLEQGQPLELLPAHAAPVTAIAVTPDGALGVTTSLDQTLRVWDLVIGRRIHSLRVESMVRGGASWGGGMGGVALCPDGRRAVTCCHDRELLLWDLPRGECVARLHAGVPVDRRDDFQAIRSLGVTPDGRYAVSCGENETFRVWDLGSPGGDQPCHYDVGARLAVPARDGRFLITVAGDGAIRALESGTWVTRALLRTDSRLTACAVAPDSTTIVVGDGAGRVHFMDLRGTSA